ncbi:hypothetical protein CLV60_13034 [Dyadobacter jiangsuensis]|uniref:Uncharacterized protein n=2 Tax=Dyadobacter jiangsuensis TaxID=1591085 RepID=A0A2P8FA50_9BACT|nr:hypothetical protein CLV60_13034 [Dyadobacter jiangsuensis]
MKMKRIFLSIVAAVAIFGASFAINSPKPVLADFTVTGETGASNEYYTVSTTPDPDCQETGAQVCKISTSATPDAQGRILKSQATVTGRKP